MRKAFSFRPFSLWPDKENGQGVKESKISKYVQGKNQENFPIQSGQVSWS